MKFGNQFSFYKIPEWTEFYLDYTSLKMILKLLDNRKNKKKGLRKLKRKISKISSESIEFSNQNCDENKKLIHKIKNKKKEIIKHIEDISEYSKEKQLNYFVNFYKQKIKIVEEFFKEKINEYKLKLENLQNKIDLNNSFGIEKNINEKKENAERDELGYAVSWKRALSNIYNITSWLHSYYSINILAMKKIQKKAKKIFLLNNIYEIENSLNEIDNSFDLNIYLSQLIDLRKKIKSIYSNELTEGNSKKALEELEQRLIGGSRIKHIKLIFFYIGVIITSFLFFISLNYIKPVQEYSFIPFFPAYNFFFIIVEVMIGISINMVILRKYKINYIYIFEIVPNSRLGSTEMFQNAFLLLSIWLSCLILTKLVLSFGFFSNDFSLFSLLLNCIIILFFFLPLHCMFYSFRRGLIKTFLNNLFPIGRNSVRFKDFLLGEILTSLNKPFASLILSYCLLNCKSCRIENKRNKECNRTTFPSLIVLFFPFLIRFLQSINRFYYTKNAWPHLGTALKAFGGLLNSIFGWIYNKFGEKYKIHYILIAIFSQSYMLFWDIYVDWGLGNFNSINYFLRDKITYPKFSYYYGIGSNVLLRFLWITDFFNLSIYIHDEWKNFIFAILEVYRRIQWCTFRIENENINNPEQYRTILTIPELPID